MAGGIHHITCVSGAPQRNVDFYCGVLGLRLVKKTVHFDNARVYHLYYGDETGTPGSLITFFPFPDEEDRGRHGAGSVSAVHFCVPEDSTAYWEARLRRLGIKAGTWRERFGDPVLEFEDHEGLCLELAATAAAGRRAGWRGGDVPPRHAVRFIAGAALSVRRPEPSIELLTTVFGLAIGAEEAGRTRLLFPGDALGMHLDVVHMPDGPDAAPVPLEGVLPEIGTVNHLAMGPATRSEQLDIRGLLAGAGLQVTGVKDRRYFQSIYTLDPAGIRLEVATGEPGFLVDESAAALGTTLQLPPWLESERPVYERLLPPIDAS